MNCDGVMQQAYSAYGSSPLSCLSTKLSAHYHDASSPIWPWLLAGGLILAVCAVGFWRSAHPKPAGGRRKPPWWQGIGPGGR